MVSLATLCCARSLAVVASMEMRDWLGVRIRFGVDIRFSIKAPTTFMLRPALTLLTAVCCGCSSTGSSAGGDFVQVSSVAPYVSDAVVSKPVHQKCELETKLPAYLADEASDVVQLVEGTPRGHRVLRMRISESVG